MHCLTLLCDLEDGNQRGLSGPRILSLQVWRRSSWPETMRPPEALGWKARSSLSSRDIASEPIMAIVSLRDQRITLYDATSWILQAPVSSGQKGRETPAGIFSVIQKEAEHYSNLCDDAFMPHMQRITWSGIALHGGPLPGFPASHGCIRMPYDFAARLFDLIRLGIRVIVAPTDVAPICVFPPGSVHAEARGRRLGRRTHRGSGGRGQEGCSARRPA